MGLIVISVFRIDKDTPGDSREFLTYLITEMLPLMQCHLCITLHRQCKYQKLNSTTCNHVIEFLNFSLYMYSIVHFKICQIL